MLYSDVCAKRIQCLCVQHGITINRLATMYGLKQSTIDNIIHGRSSPPKARTLHKIANTFNMTLSEFLDYPELNDYFPEDMEEDDGLV